MSLAIFFACGSDPAAGVPDAATQPDGNGGGTGGAAAGGSSGSGGSAGAGGNAGRGGENDAAGGAAGSSAGGRAGSSDAGGSAGSSTGGQAGAAGGRDASSDRADSADVASSDRADDSPLDRTVDSTDVNSDSADVISDGAAPPSDAGACSALPTAGLYATFQVVSDTFRASITNPSGINQALALWSGQSQAAIPVGQLDCASGAFNCGWTWSMVPSSITFAELTIEVCDATPSYVQGNCASFPNGTYCPWSAKLSELRDCRTDPSCPAVPR